MLSVEKLEEFGKRLEQTALSYQQEPFELRGGGTSHWYCDVRSTLSYGPDAKIAGELMIAKAEELGLEYDTVVGMGIGGRALASCMLSADTSLRVVEANDDPSPDQRYGYGLHGAPIDRDTRLLGVDDTGTTGSSLITMINIVRTSGGNVEYVLNLVDRSRGLVAQKLAAMGVVFHTVYNFEEEKRLLIPAA